MKKKEEKRQMAILRRPDGIYSQRKNKHDVPVQMDSKGYLRFAQFGDTHLGSKLSNEDGVAEYFRRVADEGVTELFCGGDLMDGIDVYRGQIHDLRVHGVDGQVDYAAEFLNDNLPNGLKIFGINGNHENRAFERVGVDASEQLEKKIPEKYKYLCNPGKGNIYARVQIAPGIFMDLVHTRVYVGERGAPEYTLMKLLDGYSTEDLPHLLFVNHTHTMATSRYRGVQAYLSGGFEFPNQYIARLSQGRRHGGWIMGVRPEGKRLVDVVEHFAEVHPGL